jgi:hypothetical protein
MTYWTVLVLTMFVNGHEMQSRLLFPIYEGVRCCVSSDLPQIRKDVLREQHGAMRKERLT